MLYWKHYFKSILHLHPWLWSYFYVREMELGRMPYVYITLFCLWSSMRALLMKYFDETLLLESLDQFQDEQGQLGLSMHLWGFKWKLYVCCGSHESIFITLSCVGPFLWSTQSLFLLKIKTLVYFSWDMRKVHSACVWEEAYHM